MSEQSPENKPRTISSFLSQKNVKARFHEILGKNAEGFTANLAIMVNNSAMLRECDPMSIVSSAVIAASLKLPLDPNLGFAAIVPYNEKQKDGTTKKVAQFQMMYKGFVQLAQRSGQYQTIGVTEIYEGQVLSENPLTGVYEFDFTNKESEKIIGVASYFKLINGFEKTVYWDVDKLKDHGKKYSKTFGYKSGRWSLDFEAMAKKTMIKHIISKWGIMSIELQKAVVSDQAVVSDITEDADFDYIDNDQPEHKELTAEELVQQAKEKKAALKEKKDDKPSDEAKGAKQGNLELP